MGSMAEEMLLMLMLMLMLMIVEGIDSCRDEIMGQESNTSRAASSAAKTTIAIITHTLSMLPQWHYQKEMSLNSRNNIQPQLLQAQGRWRGRR